MYESFYNKIAAPWRAMAGGSGVLTGIDNVLRVGVALAYIALLVWLAVQGDARLVRAIVVPLACFVIVSLARAGINAPRPYESTSIEPLIYKSTQGKSMPSRHMTSATIIACTILWAAGPVWGIVAFVACALIAYVRIVGGVHFPRDIAAGAAFALLCGAAGFLI